MSTVSSSEYAGAQQHRSTRSSFPVLVSWCSTPGGITAQSPGRTDRSSSAMRSTPVPRWKK